jgi:putative CocE/NonD family hydrolase
MKSSKPEYQVKVVKNIMIPMRDGVRLAADLIMPDAEGKYPALLQYHPYRKDDVSLTNNEAHHYFAQRGYVGVRLDVRGTGSSEGHSTLEYSPEEQRDSYDAIEWLAKQDWCNGNVGMWGISYSGQTSMTAGFLNPPHLKAIIPMYHCDDRYLGDCHYGGGSLRIPVDWAFYGSWMVAMNASPPYPEHVGGKWKELWTERLEKSEPWLLSWIEHQVQGPFWRSVSITGKYDQVKCPVYIIAGWRDGYPSASIRMYANLKSPKKLLVGPWLHNRPDTGIPGPRIHFFHEMQRWWDHWLKGIQNGVMEEPPVCLYVQKYDYPMADRDMTSGSWRFEKKWPIERTNKTSFFLHENGLLSNDPSGSEKGVKDAYKYIPTVGTTQGHFSAAGPSVLYVDQRLDEALSLNYSTPPLSEDLEITGFPEAVLYVSSSSDIAGFVVKLNDVDEDGTSAIVSKGYLNATRRNSFESPEPLTPGEVYKLHIPLKATSWVFEKGHRIRVSIQSSDWWNIWPTPKNAVNSIYRNKVEQSRIMLPIIPPSNSDLPRPVFLAPPHPAKITDVQMSPSEYSVVRDYFKKTTSVVSKSSSSIKVPELNSYMSSKQDVKVTASDLNPESVSLKSTSKLSYPHSDNMIDVTSFVSLKSTVEHYHVIINLDIEINKRPYFHKNWTRTVERVLA